MKLLKLKPVITEKTIRLLKETGTYTFKGLASYKAKDVKAFLEKEYGVRVMDIRAVNIPPKRRYNFVARKPYIRKGYRKFYVKFKKQVKIPGFNIN